MMNKFLMACLALLSSQMVAYGQETPLVLEQALTALEVNAHTLQSLEKDKAMITEQLDASKQRFLPQVQFSYTGAYTNSPLNAFGFKLEQQVVQQSDFAPDLLNNPDALSNFNTKIEVMQPIFNYDAQMGQQLWQHQLEAVDLQRGYALSQLQFELKKAYVQLQLLYASKEVLKEAETTLQAHLKIVDNFVTEGLGKASDQLAVKAKLQEVASQQVEVAKNIQQLSAYVAYLTGATASNTYQPSEKLEDQPALQVWEASIDDSRADFMAYQKQIDAQTVGLSMTKAQRLPRVNAFGAFNLNDESPVGFGGNNFMVGMKLSWQLHLGKQLSSKVNTQQIAIEKSEMALADRKAQEQMLLSQTISAYQATAEQISYTEAGLALAQEELRVAQNRFKEGLEKSADILAMTTKVSQTQWQIKKLYAQLKQYQYKIESLK